MSRIPDYREPPEGFHFLIGLGVQKSGTGWLDRYLRDHPDVHMPGCKEMNYFNTRYSPQPPAFAEMRRETLSKSQNSWRVWMQLWRDYVVSRLRRSALPGNSPTVLRRLVEMHDAEGLGHEAYWSLLMRGYRGQPCAADITPQYAMLSEAALTKIADDFPAARFLLVLRDPLQRTWSHLRMIYRRRAAAEPIKPAFDDFLDTFLAGENRIVLNYSDYPVTLRALERAVPKDRQLVLFYENMFNDQGIAELCSFAGVRFRPGAYGKVIHEGLRQGVIRPDIEAQLRRQLKPVYREVRGRFGDVVPQSWELPN